MTDSADRRLPPNLRSRVFRQLVDRLGQYEFGVLAGLLVLSCGILAFIWLADEVTDGETMRFDEWAVRILRRPDNPAIPWGPSWFAEVGRDVTALGGVAFLLMLTTTVAGFLWLQRMHAAMWLVLSSTFGGLLVSLLLKSLFDRPRPALVPHLSIVHTSSFPSGHAMMSATVFMTLGILLGQFVDSLRLKAYFLLVALAFTLLVGCSRVYMGVHYPTDVLAGWSAGLTWAIGCGLAARWLQKRGLVENLELQTHASGEDAKPDRPPSP